MGRSLWSDLERGRSPAALVSKMEQDLMVFPGLTVASAGCSTCY